MDGGTESVLLLKKETDSSSTFNIGKDGQFVPLGIKACCTVPADWTASAGLAPWACGWGLPAGVV